ncbi:MAG TPA: lyase family protein [Methylomirabilota bacterium]|nr:lyase family protein [Methylomirabilota bacterium]
MSARAFHSEMMSGLLGDAEIQGLVDDRARVRAMLAVEAALARAEADVGIIPAEAGALIAAAAERLDVAPSDLAEGMARDGVPVPALVRRLKAAVPEAHRGHVHHGATSQDIVDTAMVLTTLDALAVLRARLLVLIDGLARLAERHARDLIAGRTRHQLASPTTFGLKVVSWTVPLARHVERLDAMRPRFAMLSLSGASGNLAVLGGAGPAVEARMAAILGLNVAVAPWHTARDGVAEVGGVLVLIAGSLGKIGADVVSLAQNEVGEVRPGSAGGSSTMPHKANPIAAEMLVTLARTAAERSLALMNAIVSVGERDGAAWTAEWIALPELLVAAGASTSIASGLIEGLVVDTSAMTDRVMAAPGLLHSELAVFALAGVMPRPDAEAAVAAATKTALADRRHLVDVLRTQSGAAIDWDALHRLDSVVHASATRVERALAALARYRQVDPETKAPAR